MIHPFVTDAIILLLFILFAIDGYRRGFLLLCAELVVLFATLWLAALSANAFGHVLHSVFNLSSLIEKPVGFFVGWFVYQAAFNLLLSWSYVYLPEKWRESRIDQILGVFPSLAKGGVVIAILLALLALLPTKAAIRESINKSRIGKPMVTTTQRFEQQLARRYNQELTQTLTFLTNTPLYPKGQEEDEKTELHFTTTNVSPDAISEQMMLKLVNQERAKAGLNPLFLDTSLRKVARAHAADMFARGYFAHTNLDGEDPFDRLHNADIIYAAAGENLAYAPTVEIAHTGLMNSPKHRDNILYPEFGHIGIGVIDAGIYGKMFVQEFSD